jgi:hypothetical protein
VTHGFNKNDWFQHLQAPKEVPSPSHQYGSGVLFYRRDAGAGKDINMAAKPVRLLQYLIHWCACVRVRAPG